MYNCIIFDVDGTLIDTENAVFSIYQRMVSERLGRNISDEEIKNAYAVPTIQALKQLGFNNDEKAVRDFHQYLMESFKKVKPFEGIMKVLMDLAQNNKVTGIVTSRSSEEVMEDPCLQKMLAYFSYLVCTSDTKRHKPHPEPLLKVVELSGLKVSDTIYIGDSHIDCKCAENAGIDFALALWGARNTDNINAKYMLKHPGQLLEIMNGR